MGGDGLWMEDGDYAHEPGVAPMFEKLSLADLEERIAEQMGFHFYALCRMNGPNSLGGWKLGAA